MKRVSACAVVLTIACATHTAPPGFLSTPRQAQTDTFGGWIELRVTGTEQRTEGELLAVTEDSVWVLTTDSALVLPTAAVHSGKLTAYGAPSASGWIALGVVSTISNGVVLILTAPLWLLSGGLTSNSDHHAAQRATPTVRWGDLAMFARFPQGMPADVALRSLKPMQN